MKNLILLLSLLFFLSLPHAHAQEPGSNDSTFDPGAGVSRSGTAGVFAIALQPDSKILIVGDFTSVNQIARGRVARLNINGSVDAGFDTSTGADNEVLALVLQPDGKVLIAGSFTNVNNTARTRIARLNSDGSLDSSFNPGSGPGFDIFALALQPDGKVLIGGAFEQVSGTPRHGLARLNANGSVDTTFDANLGSEASLDAIALQGDKILISGVFSGSSGFGVKRLNADGSPDTTFQTVAGLNGEVSSILPLPSDKVLITGAFQSAGTTPLGRIARLNGDGSLDSTFNPGSGANAQVISAVLQPDGRIIIGGNFDRFNGTARGAVARLEPNGALDTNYNRGTGVAGSVQSLALQTDGKLLVGGFFSAVNGVERNGIARLNADVASVEPTLSIVRNGANVTISWPAPATGFVLQSTANLSQWQAAPETPQLADNRWQVTLPADQPRRLFRLRSGPMIAGGQ